MKRQYLGFTPTQIKRHATDAGESIEEMIRRNLATNQPISADAPMVYTEKEDEVLPEYDIRTDRQEIALDALDKYHASDAMKKANEAPRKEDAEETAGDAPNAGAE